MASYNMFEIAAMSAPEDNWGYRYETFGAPDGGEEKTPITDDEDEEAVPDGPMCPARYTLVMEAATAGAMMDALKVHETECAACGSGRKIVATDRELVDANAVCCEGKAA